LTSEERDLYENDLDRYTSALGVLDFAKREGIEIGIEKGKEEGRKEERRKFAKSLKRLGLHLDVIANELEITLEEVQLYLED